MNLTIIRKAIAEFSEYSKIVANKVGGVSRHYIGS